MQQVAQYKNFRSLEKPGWSEVTLFFRPLKQQTTKTVPL